MAAPTNAALVKKVLANSEPSAAWPNAEVKRPILLRRRNPNFGNNQLGCLTLSLRMRIRSAGMVVPIADPQ